MVDMDTIRLKLKYTNMQNEIIIVKVNLPPKKLRAKEKGKDKMYKYNNRFFIAMLWCQSRQDYFRN